MLPRPDEAHMGQDLDPMRRARAGTDLATATTAGTHEPLLLVLAQGLHIEVSELTTEQLMRVTWALVVRIRSRGRSSNSSSSSNTISISDIGGDDNPLSVFVMTLAVCLDCGLVSVGMQCSSLTLTLDVPGWSHRSSSAFLCIDADSYRSPLRIWWICLLAHWAFPETGAFACPDNRSEAGGIAR